MKVCELIEKLRQYDPEVPVVTNGFDSCGLEDIDTVFKIRHVRDIGTGSHSPAHDFPYFEDLEACARAVPAVYIGWMDVSKTDLWPE